MTKRLNANSLRNLLFPARLPRKRRPKPASRVLKLEIKDWLSIAAIVISLFALLVPNIISYEIRKQRHNQGLFTSFNIGRSLGQIYFESISHVKPNPSLGDAFKATIGAELSSLGISLSINDLKYETISVKATDPFASADSLVALIQIGDLIDAYQGFDARMLMRFGFWLEITGFDKTIVSYGFPINSTQCGTWDLYEAGIYERFEQKYGLPHLSRDDCKNMTPDAYQNALNRDAAKIMVELSDRSTSDQSR